MNQDVLKSWDKYINWEKRLHYEIPFFNEVFKGNGSKKLLDACCGSGRHAIELSHLGFEVVGIDSSDDILDSARFNSKNAALGMSFSNCDIMDLSCFSDDEFDGIYCIGNSLALLDSKDDFEKAISNFTRILRKGGIFVIHLVDLNKMELNGQYMLPVITGHENGSERILCRIFHVSDETQSYVTFVLIEKDKGKWKGKNYRQNLVRIKASDMEEIFGGLKYEKIELYSSFKKHPIEDINFTGMIVIAQK